MQNTFVLVHLIAIFVASSHAQAASILHEDFQGLTATGSHVSYPFERESGTYQLFATVAGWTQTGDASQFIKVNGQSGNTSLILNEGGSAPNTISRTIGGLIPGLKYKVTFEHWADLGFGTYTFDWEINGTTFSVVDAGSGQASGNFRAVNYDFVATTDTTLLRFAETSITSTSITLDNIKIEPQIPKFAETFSAVTATGPHNSYPFEREAGTYQLFANVTGWTQTGDASQFIKVNGDSGNTSLILNEGGSAPNTISRSIGGLVPGRTYLLVFEHWADLGFGTYAFDWEINGTTFSVVDTGLGPASGNFRTVNHAFVATTTSTSLRFSETSTTGTSVTLDNLYLWEMMSENQRPTAEAGPDQAVRPGDTVFLNGLGSSDDNTDPTHLDYVWTLEARPVGSSAALAAANSSSPSFIADAPGTYLISLVVVDSQGKVSLPDSITISSLNLAPTANAGFDGISLVHSPTHLDGSDSHDPEEDPLVYSWTIVTAPEGSVATLEGQDSAAPILTPDLEGTYVVSLSVSDAIGRGIEDSVQILAVMPEDFAEIEISGASSTITAFESSEVTAPGNQNSLVNFLMQAMASLEEGDIVRTAKKLEEAIARVDGCALRGSPDGNGQGRDWVTNCAAQAEVYASIVAAREALASAE